MPTLLAACELSQEGHDLRWSDSTAVADPEEADKMEAADCRLCNWAAGPSFEGGSGWHISVFPTGDERWQDLVHKWRNCP